ncbi:SDR family oxidoreductase [Myxococcaceae bacterium JPH2]|nr:SDR family oxidoreductase [Myxococcaceae bacterium JPH2]
MDWRNKQVVVMGGSSGVGEATARRLVAQGARVVITGRDADKLARVATSLGAQARGVVVDGTNATAVRAFFAELGAFDHLVVCLSGAEGAGAFRDLDLAGLRRGFEAKFWAHLTVVQAALGTLRPDGSVTLVTAASARTAFAGASGLAAINGALEAMVPPLALELAPLRVNAVSPGVINTPWWDKAPAAQRDAIFATSAATLPVRRVGTPEDVADAIVFVAGNGFMTGTVIECDGGARLA